MKTSRGSDDSLRCSFCHKSQDAVAKLISSPSDYPRAYICDECVGVCNSILEDDKSEAQPGTAPAHLPKPDVMLRRAKKWQPWRSVASWYLWRACDLAGSASPPPE